MISLARLWQVYRELGPYRFARHVWSRVSGGLGWQSSFNQRLNAVDRVFDSTHGVDTGGIVRLHRLTIAGCNSRHGAGHIASDPEQFHAAINALDMVFENFTFIDLGSGKGRALLLANNYAFRRIIGVEFAVELHQIAQNNVQNAKQRIELVLGDAADYAFPPDSLVIYLYNSFNAVIVAAVASRLFASWRSQKRPIFVVYVNPMHAQAWVQAGWCLRHDIGFAMIFQPPT